MLLSAQAAQKYLACIIVRHVLKRKLTVTILPVHAFDITYNTILGTSWKYLLVGHFRNASTDNYLKMNSPNLTHIPKMKIVKICH